MMELEVVSIHQVTEEMDERLDTYQADVRNNLTHHKFLQFHILIEK